ncbi:MAG: hypothetical protein ACFFD2_12855 [Promethearchaeota archaeon]
MASRAIVVAFSLGILYEIYFPLIAVPRFLIRFPKVGDRLRVVTFFRPNLKTFPAFAILSKLSKDS